MIGTTNDTNGVEGKASIPKIEPSKDRGRVQ
jgi:hypothetical protein